MINGILAIATKGQPTPVAGMGATILSHSDRSPATIFRVIRKGKSTIVQTRDDKVTWDADKNPVFKTDVTGARRHFRFLDGGNKWQAVRLNEETGRWLVVRYPGLRIGEKDHYYDPHF